jgi:hypothetical protein
MVAKAFTPWWRLLHDKIGDRSRVNRWSPQQFPSPFYVLCGVPMKTCTILLSVARKNPTTGVKLLFSSPWMKTFPVTRTSGLHWSLYESRLLVYCVVDITTLHRIVIEVA